MDTTTKQEILETIAEAINAADKLQEYGLGDRLFDAIIKLKTEWNIDLDD